VGDPTLVDLVGYGTANCREGGTNAPAPSNTTAIFRKNGGSADTNVNGSDFQAGTPNPRRTAVISEIGPYVLSVDPRRSSSSAPRDASISVTFTESVEVAAAWYDVTCAVTGSHNDATVAGAGRFWVVTPNVNFEHGEQCTVTIFKDAVQDSDLDDSEPGTDNLKADYAWTFTVTGAGSEAPYPRGVHLTMGNPTDATADPNQPNNYLMEKDGFTLSYNRERGTPNWVSWHLDSSWYGSLARVDTFRTDPAVPAHWYRVQAIDYFSSGFDRGLMVPNADRDHQDSLPRNQETFLMTNMIPQSPDNNQGPWANLEAYLRTVTDAGNEIYIVSGPAGVGGTGSGGLMTTIANGKVTVPSHTWKVALVLPREDGNDVARATAATRTIAVIMPNRQGSRTNNPNDWQTYLTTVDAVEELTGYDFFENLPDAVENSVEAGVNGANPPGTEDGAFTTAEDTPTTVTMTAAGATGTLTYTIVSGPSHGTLSGTGSSRTYAPAPDFNGTDSFTFRVSDGNGTSNISTISILVTEVNDAPVLAPVGDKTVFLGDTLAFTASAADADMPAQTLTYSLTGAFPAGASINPATGDFTWTPTAAQAGQTYTFGVRVTDDGPGQLHAEEVITVGSAYTWSGYLQPINQDGGSVFRRGSTIPVKFQLTGASAGVTNAVARLYVAKVTDDVVGTEEKADSAASATEGNLFRYSDGQYVLNLGTAGLTAGTYQLRVDMGDGVQRLVLISLR